MSRSRLHTCAIGPRYRHVDEPNQAAPPHAAQTKIATTRPSTPHQIAMVTEPLLELTGQ